MQNSNCCNKIGLLIMLMLLTTGNRPLFLLGDLLSCSGLKLGLWLLETTSRTLMEVVTIFSPQVLKM